MRLINKKTGKIGELVAYDPYKGIFAVKVQGGDRCYYYSLSDLYEVWEDYEEPKQWYGLNAIRDVGFEPLEYEGFEDLYKHAKELGIAFETKEEAEKAVERLRAWKRLKDRGFRFDGYDVAHNSNGDLCGQLFYNAGDYCIEDVEKDLDLLFGGEE